MRFRAFLLAVAALSQLASPVVAQPRFSPPRPANSNVLPPGISVKKTAIGDVYVDAKGRTLYGLDVVALFVEMRSPFTYCTGACEEMWEPVAAPAGTPQGPPNAPRFIGRGTQSGPDWVAVNGAKGPQLLFKQGNLVFVRKDDVPGSTKWDGDKNYLWNALRYVPPIPKVKAPSGFSAAYIDGAYALADKDERILYTQDRPAKCVTPCIPLKTGLVVSGSGEWTVSRTGEVAQWAYRGKPVYVSAPKSAGIPEGATILRP
jgi:predicted lipoprotein with Yx(FWY)xxD motif